MKSKVFNIVVVVVISLLTITTVYQGIVIDDNTGMLLWTERDLRADLDELGAYTFSMEACDMELMENLNRRAEIWGMINGHRVDSVWQYLYWDDMEAYHECLDRISVLQEELLYLEAEWRELVSYKYNLLSIMEDKWEPK